MNLHFALWVQLPDGQEHHTDVSLDDQEYMRLQASLEALQADNRIADYTLAVAVIGSIEDVLDELEDLTGAEVCYDGECPECADKTEEKRGEED